MYADQLEAQTNRSVKDRLNRNFASGAGVHRPIVGKRRREDDGKWEHDLFQDDELSVSSRKSQRIGVRDLRLKLQRKSIIEQANQNLRQSASNGRDLREKLSGIFHSRSKPVRKVRKPIRKSAAAQVPNPETSKTSSLAKKQVSQKVDSADNFLRSLGLEKYSITLKAEEVDMTALLHMRDEDLKALGIPMGPRKKILLALESKSIG